MHLFLTRPLAWSLSTLSLLLLASCVSDAGEEMVPGAGAPDYSFIRPLHFPEPAFDLDREPITEAGFKLGERLFEDVRLSSTLDVSCGSCHSQAAAFADPQHAVSIGVDNRAGTRNAPQLSNLAFSREFFWDGGVTHLDFVPTVALEAFHEMDITVAEAVRRVAADASYGPMFEAAYGTDSVSGPRMMKAWSQYVRRMVSATSAYDKYVLGIDGATLSADQLRGRDAFERACASCHAGQLFTDHSYRNNGLDSVHRDPGRELITEDPRDRGRFRVPSLRNVERTAPYMHDGRFGSIAEVIRHYRFGIRESATLDAGLRDGVTLTDDEAADIEAFLLTLTDWDFIRDPMF